MTRTEIVGLAVAVAFVLIMVLLWLVINEDEQARKRPGYHFHPYWLANGWYWPIPCHRGEACSDPERVP